MGSDVTAAYILYLFLPVFYPQGAQLNNFSTTRTILVLKVSMDRTHQDLNLCLRNKPLGTKNKFLEFYVKFHDF